MKGITHWQLTKCERSYLNNEIHVYFSGTD